MVQRNIIWILLLTLLWAIYVLFRANYHVDSLVSDEAFYFHQNIGSQSKRVIFLNLVQSFQSWESARWAVILINLLCLIISQLLLSEFFLKNNTATFFWLFYFSAIAAYVFRDTIILLLVSAFLFGITNRNKNQHRKTGRITDLIRLRTFGLVLLLMLLLDFRPHYVAIIVFSGLGTYLASKSVRLFSLLLLCGLGAFIFYFQQLTELNIYGISVDEYMQYRADTSHVDTSPMAYGIGLVRHFFAPIPTSIVRRLFDPEMTYVYGWLDDTYRLVYRVYVYFCMLYVAINFRYISHVFKTYQNEAVFITMFSLSNAILYTAFSFGGGHERTKVFSMMFLVFIFCAIQKIKTHRRVLRQNSRSQLKVTEQRGLGEAN